MKSINKITISIFAFLSFGLAVPFVFAQPGPMGGSGPGMMRGGIAQNQMMGQSANLKIMQELMTPAERLAMMDQMIDAKTVKERQAIMAANHVEMLKRAKEKGIAMPAGYGPQMMFGENCR